jgi:YVTN family beta-propeller protein
MRNDDSRWRKLLSLVLLVGLLLTCGAAARDRKGKKDDPKKMDPSKGDILLAGLVYSPETGGGNNSLGEGMGAIRGAKVVLEGTGYETETDANGMFVFTAGPEGPVSILISKDGYRSEKRSATIEKDASEPVQIRVELMPAGTNYVGKTPTGTGTLYVAYSQRVLDHSNPHSTWDRNLQTMSSAIAAGADPLTLEGNAPGESRNPTDTEFNPVNDAPNSIMILPPKSPSRTGFHNTAASPYWLCFDQSGKTLYVANSAHQIQVLDASNNNNLVANLPAQQGGVITSLALSADGRYVMATVMAVAPGVMMIDTATRQPAAYLSIDGVGTMTPTDVASSPDGSRLFVTLDGQAAQSGKGLLVAIDPYSGMTLGTAAVGAAPTGVVLSKDGRLAYVANSGGGSVTVVDAWGMSPIGLLQVGVSPQKLAVTPDGSRVFVTNKGSNTVTVINTMTNTIIGTVNVGKAPLDVAVSLDGSLAFVSNKDDGTISVIDVGRQAAIHVTDPMPKSSPFGLAIRP